jgi:hypothetical protein
MITFITCKTVVCRWFFSEHDHRWMIDYLIWPTSTLLLDVCVSHKKDRNVSNQRLDSSIKFLYFFIISSLFPYFNLFVSIFIQSHVNNNLYVSILGSNYNVLAISAYRPWLTLWIRISIRARCTTLCDKVCQWFFPGPPVSSTNKTDSHDITEIIWQKRPHGRWLGLYFVINDVYSLRWQGMRDSI